MRTATATSTEIEFSKGWVQNYPELFATKVLRFLAAHDSVGWELEMRQTKGFLVIGAKLILPTIAA